jgi:hypothetical protein
MTALLYVLAGVVAWFCWAGMLLFVSQRWPNGTRRVTQIVAVLLVLWFFDACAQHPDWFFSGWEVWW